MIAIGDDVTRPAQAFRNRKEAGDRLLEFLDSKDRNWAILAVPRGGVLVAESMAKGLNAPLELAFCRKIPIPDSPEAGFGAVALDGSVVLDDEIVRRKEFSLEQIDRMKKDVMREVRRRAQIYPMGNSFDATDKDVLLVDDGLATGYTMIAAAKMARRMKPRSLTLAVPVSPSDSLVGVQSYFDDIYCLYRQTTLPFAVASFYKSFPDLEDREVIGAAERANQHEC